MGRGGRRITARLGLEPSHGSISSAPAHTSPWQPSAMTQRILLVSRCRTPLGQTAVWGALLRVLGDILDGTLLVTIQRAVVGHCSCSKGCREEREIPSVPGLWVLLNRLSVGHSLRAEAHLWPASEAHRGRAHRPQEAVACPYLILLSLIPPATAFPFPSISFLAAAVLSATLCRWGELNLPKQEAVIP